MMSAFKLKYYYYVVQSRRSIVSYFYFFIAQKKQSSMQNERVGFLCSRIQRQLFPVVVEVFMQLLLYK